MKLLNKEEFNKMDLMQKAEIISKYSCGMINKANNRLYEILVDKNSPRMSEFRSSNDRRVDDIECVNNDTFRVICTEFSQDVKDYVKTESHLVSMDGAIYL